MATMLFRLTILFYSGLALVLAINWSRLKEELNGVEGELAAMKVATNWLERPADFFQNISEECWNRIVPLLSPVKIATIRGEEFADNFSASRAFALQLSSITNAGGLSKTFRFAVCDVLYTRFEEEPEETPTSTDTLLWAEGNGARAMASISLSESPSQQRTDNNFDSNTKSQFKFDREKLKKINQNLSKMIKAIPSVWIEEDGETMVKALLSHSPSRLGLLNVDSLRSLFKNSNGTCRLLVIDSLKSLTPEKLGLMSPVCMAAIKGLAGMDLSPMLYDLPSNVFSLYNGPLSISTLNQLSAGQLWEFGSLCKSDELICKLLDLAHVDAQAIGFVSARCLHGYLSKRSPGQLSTHWMKLSISTLMQFTPTMQSVWGNISPTDFSFMPIATRHLILSSPHACVNLDVYRIDSVIMEGLSARGLHALLSKGSSGPLEFKDLWGRVLPSTIVGFTNAMLNAFKSVSVTDIAYMPPWVLQVFLGSKAVLLNLENSIEPIILSPLVSSMSLTRESFLAIAKAAPNIAGQLLLLVKRLPDDILADCDGQVIRSLTLTTSNRILFDWKLLFLELAKAKPKPSLVRILSLMSSGTGAHFCSTISSIEEYLSIPWLGANITSECLSALSFELKNACVYLKAPELTVGAFPWRRLLESCKASSWVAFFSTQNFATYLGQDCQFWLTLGQEHQDIMLVVERTALRGIEASCIPKLGQILQQNVELVPFLAPNAFEFHQVGELPCSLKFLTPGQIARLSRLTLVDPASPTRQEIIEHALARIDLKEFNSLNYRQFKFIINFQWEFVPERVKMWTLNEHYTRSMRELREFIALHDMNKRLASGEPPPAAKAEENSSRVLDAFDLFMTVRHKELVTYVDFDLVALFEIFRKSKSRKRFLAYFAKSSLLKPLMMALARNAQELRVCLRDGMNSIKDAGDRIELSYHTKTGFNQAQALQFLSSFPESFAGLQAFIKFENGIDSGGPMRMLISQILTTIQRDIIRAGPQITNVNLSEYFDGNGEPKDVQDDHKFFYTRTTSANADFLGKPTEHERISANHCKFIWGVSGEAGFIVGLVFGKALQLDLRLPFSFDPAFFALLVDSNEITIESYYEAAYGREIDGFKKDVIKLRGPAGINVKELEEVLTRPECIRFAKLSTEFDTSRALLDLPSRTNIKSCSSNDESFTSCVQFVSDKALDDYFQTIRKSTLQEFKTFIQEFKRGFAYAVPSVKGFSTIPAIVLPLVPIFFSQLLNMQLITPKDLIRHISFDNDQDIPSIIPTEYVAASQVVVAFIKSLNAKQLEHLVGIWTGASTLSLPYTALSVTFYGDQSLKPFQIDFCRPDSRMESTRTDIISSGTEYLNFFKKFAENLFSSKDFNIEPDCSEGGVKIIPIIASTCLNSLTIHPQTAQSLLNSLIDMMNGPLMAIRDN